MDEQARINLINDCLALTEYLPKETELMLVGAQSVGSAAPTQKSFPFITGIKKPLKSHEFL